MKMDGLEGEQNGVITGRKWKLPHEVMRYSEIGFIFIYVIAMVL